METTIPFSGFYYSLHSSEIENVLENIYSDDQGRTYSQKLVDLIFQTVDFKSIHGEYAERYTEHFADMFELKLKFKLMSSPKYYNFQTDRIFCEIELAEVKRIFSVVDKENLQEIIQANFTSRSGFISHYSNDLEDWPTELADWDHNQVGTLIECYVSSHEEYNDGEFEFEIAQRMAESDLYSIVESNIPDERVWKLVDYFRLRSEREYAKKYASMRIES